jgi:hypothetical protein
MMRLLILGMIPLWLIIQFFLFIPDVKGQKQTPNGKKDIELLSRTFSKAISNQDSVALIGLFFSHQTPVIGVMALATEAQYRKNNPQFQGISVSTAGKFVKEICTQYRKPEERIRNLQIVADSTVASVSFDYAFYNEGKLLQWGKEYWNLVYAEGQWLITSANYLIRKSEIEQPSF